MRLGVVAIARPTFDVPFAQETADTATMNLTDAGYELAGSSELLMDSVSLADTIEMLNHSDIDALVVLQASFADSSLALQAAEIGVPIVLWAFPEKRTGERLRLNSFCGINLAGYALTEAGSDYRWLYMEADDVRAPSEIHSLLEVGQTRQAIATVRETTGFNEVSLDSAEMVLRRLQSTTIGRVGEGPDGFEPCNYEHGLLRKSLGVTVDEVALPELFKRADSAEDSDIAPIRDRASLHLSGIDNVDQLSLDRSLRLNIGLSSLISDHNWSGVATRCWPETFTEFGGAACTPMALLTEDGTPGVCEADVYGSITGLILSWLGDSDSFVTDLVHLDTETNTGVLWHCGLAPFSMADPESTPEATIHSNRAMPLLSEFPLKPGRVTLARVSQSRRQHRIILGGGEMIRAPLAFSGTSGVVRFDSPVDQVLSTVMDEGLEHHFGIVYGDVTNELHALASLLNMPVVEL